METSRSHGETTKEADRPRHASALRRTARVLVAALGSTLALTLIAGYAQAVDPGAGATATTTASPTPAATTTTTASPTPAATAPATDTATPSSGTTADTAATTPDASTTPDTSPAPTSTADPAAPPAGTPSATPTTSNPTTTDPAAPDPATTDPATATPVTTTTSNGVDLTTAAAQPATHKGQPAQADPRRVVIAEIPATTTATYSLLAFSWASTSGPAPTLYVRTHSAGAWSPWYPFATGAGDTIQAADGRQSTDATWVGVSDGIDLEAAGQATSAIAGLEAHLIDPATGTTAVVPMRASVMRNVSASPAFIAQPAIVTRAQWGAAPMKGCDKLYDSTILAATIHHTAGSNDYTAAQSAGIVKGVQAYHQSLGWCDIGYNFLIDKYGTIFEGRAGGMDVPVHGAHAASFNDNTFGVSFMMNSSTMTVPQVSLDAAANLLAWKFADAYIDPQATVTLHGKTLSTIFGHGDAMSTECPGTSIRAKLPWLRDAVTTLIANSKASPIEQLWDSLGGADSDIGPVYQGERDIAGGRYTVFSHGRIFWSAATGAEETIGGINAAYIAYGGATSALGFPTTAEFAIPSGREQDFQGGYITWTSKGATVTVGKPSGNQPPPATAKPTPTPKASPTPNPSTVAAPVPALTDTTGLFIYSILPAAQEAERQFGVPTSVSIAQAILESGWGSSILARWGQAYFGIKCSATSSYVAGCVDKSTREVVDGADVMLTSTFRTYADVTSSFLDHGYFLKNSARYASAFTAGSPDGFVQELSKDGYATDPNYASQLINNMKKYNLYQYDLTNAKPLVATTIEPLQPAIAADYALVGGPTGDLSYPVGPIGTGPVANSQMESFDKGAIFSSLAAGTHALRGAFWKAFSGSEALRTKLGLPIEEQMIVGPAAYQKFEHGMLCWTRDKGIYECTTPPSAGTSASPAATAPATQTASAPATQTASAPATQATSTPSANSATSVPASPTTSAPATPSAPVTSASSTPTAAPTAPVPSATPSAPVTSPSPTPPASPPTPAYAVSYSAYVQGNGWMGTVGDGATAGTTDTGLPIEALAIQLNGAPAGSHIFYQMAIPGYTALYGGVNGSTAGLTDASTTADSLRIAISGPIAAAKDIWYRVYVQDYGWLGWAKNGNLVGSMNKGLEIQAVQVVLTPAGSAAPGSTANAFLMLTPATTPPATPAAPTSAVSYAAYVQGNDWMAAVGDGATAGTTGTGRPVEALAMQLNGAPAGSNISYQVTIPGYAVLYGGVNGSTAGLTGQNTTADSLRISMTGPIATTKDLWYRVYVHNRGWLGWAKNGNLVGSMNKGLAIEAVQVVLTPAGSAAPGSTANAFLW